MRRSLQHFGRRIRGLDCEVDHRIDSTVELFREFRKGSECDRDVTLQLLTIGLNAGDDRESRVRRYRRLSSSRP